MGEGGNAAMSFYNVFYPLKNKMCFYYSSVNAFTLNKATILLSDRDFKTKKSTNFQVLMTA